MHALALAISRPLARRTADSGATDSSLSLSSAAGAESVAAAACFGAPGPSSSSPYAAGAALAAALAGALVDEVELVDDETALGVSPPV